jgi:hypothetical protein
MYDQSHRPSKVDEIGKGKLREEILEKKDSLRPMTKSNFQQAVIAAVKETETRRGGNGESARVHSTTVASLLKEIGGTLDKGQTTTNAGYRESRDIRNFISMAVMNEAYATGKAKQMIGNYDSTQFIESEKSDELLLTIKREHLDGSSDDGSLPLTLVDDSALDFGVKWMMTASTREWTSFLLAIQI